MRKIYLLTVLIGFSTVMFGQTLLTEDFSGNVMPPAGWSIDTNSANWSIHEGESAGGTTPEGHFFYDPSFNAISRFISPEVDLTGQTMVAFSFKHFLDDYDGSGYTLAVETRSGGGAWNRAWSVNPTGDIGPIEQIIEINNSDVGAADFQVALVFDGNSYNLDNWYIDDIALFIPFNLDAALSSIDTKPYVNGAVTVEGYVTNMGSTPITDVTINWQADGGMVYETEISGLNLNFTDNYMYQCTQLFDFPVGAYDLQVWVADVNQLGNDDNPDNDLQSKTINVASNDVANIP